MGWGSESGSEKERALIRKPLALLAVAVAVVGVAGLLHSTPVEATSHRAVRSFSAPWVLPGGALEVTITAAGYGGFGQGVETLPSGFSYEGSDLSEAAVAVEGQTVAFTLLGDERFTYTVTAPSAEGVYSFSGVLLDANKAEQTVGGYSSIRVGPAPTPTPTPEPTPTPTPEPTADPGADANADPGAYGNADPGAYGNADPGAHSHPDDGAHGNADPGAHSHPDDGASDRHADAGAHSHPDDGASDRHTHSHRGAGTHPHVGSPAPASGAGTRGRPATRVARSDRGRGRLGDRRRHSVRPQTAAVDHGPR